MNRGRNQNSGGSNGYGSVVDNIPVFLRRRISDRKFERKRRQKKKNDIKGKVQSPRQATSPKWKRRTRNEASRAQREKEENVRKRMNEQQGEMR